MASVMLAATVPLLAFGSISMPERSLMRSEARISAAAGTGQSTLNFTFEGDGFGAMSGTSNVKSEMLILRPAGVSAIPCPIVTVAVRPVTRAFKSASRTAGDAVDRTRRDARRNDVDGETVVRNRRPLAR